MRSLALFAAIPVCIGALTMSLQAYDRLPSPSGGEDMAPTAGSSTTESRTAEEIPRRMQVNHILVRMQDRGPAVAFYAQYTRDGHVAAVIMETALRLEVPVNLAFALAWQESRFNVKALSARNPSGTRDWGLFQLNDGSRADWQPDDFFDPARNTEAGLRYLRFCLAEMGSTEAALAAYNAGVRGVRELGVPEATKAHVRAILAYERQLDRSFAKRF